MKTNYLFYGIIFTVLFVFSSIYFRFFGAELDIAVSNFFYQPESKSFLMESNLFVIFFNKWLYYPIKYFFLPCLCLLFILMVYRKSERSFKVGFLVVCLIFGPVLFVNVITKDIFHRARPNSITEFGGNKIFTAAWEVSTQCENNCSFVSGHASVYFYFTAFAFVFSRYYRQIMAFIMVIGLVVVFCRISVGAHFLSDTLISAFATLTINFVVAHFMLNEYNQREFNKKFKIAPNVNTANN